MGTLILTSNWPEVGATITVNGVAYSVDAEISSPDGQYAIEASWLYGYVTPASQVLDDNGTTLVVEINWNVDTAFWTAIDTRIYPHIRDTIVCRGGVLGRV